MDAAIISIITSLIISGITFIFGLKSGKNQADREKLQNLYKEMYGKRQTIRSPLKDAAFSAALFPAFVRQFS